MKAVVLISHSVIQGRNKIGHRKVHSRNEENKTEQLKMCHEI